MPLHYVIISMKDTFLRGEQGRTSNESTSKDLMLLEVLCPCTLRIIQVNCVKPACFRDNKRGVHCYLKTITKYFNSLCQNIILLCCWCCKVHFMLAFLTVFSLGWDFRVVGVGEGRKWRGVVLRERRIRVPCGCLASQKTSKMCVCLR